MASSTSSGVGDSTSSYTPGRTEVELGRRGDNNNNTGALPDILPLMNGNASSDQPYIHASKSKGLISKRAARNNPSVASSASSGGGVVAASKDGLTRSESGHSLGALSYTTYDPKTTGSLSRSEEVNISLYEQGPYKRSYESLIDNEYGKFGKSEENADIQRISIGDTIAEKMEVNEASGRRTAETKSYVKTNGHDQLNGHAEKLTIGEGGLSGSNEKRQKLEGNAGAEANVSRSNSSTTPTNTMEKKASGRPRKPQVGGSATGTFQMRSAYNSLPRDEPKSPAASDDNFKGALQDTLSRKITATTTTPSSPGRGRKQKVVGSSPKTGRKSEGGVGRTSSGRSTTSTASNRTEKDSSRATSLAKQDVSTDEVRLSRVESSSSQRSTRVAGDLSKKDSVRSTTSTNDPGRPPSGKGGKVSRSSSVTEPVSPKTSSSSVTAALASTPARRTESTKSSSSIKASSLERLAEPKHRKSISTERKERRGSVDSGSSRRGSVDSSSGRRGSGSDQGSKKESPSGSRSSSKEGKRTSTITTEPQASPRLSKASVTKSDSARSGSAPSYAAGTSASSAKRSESGRSSTTSRPLATASRTSSNASTRGQFSMKHSTGTVSPPGSVFDIANDDVEKKEVISVDTTGAKVKRASSSSSQRKVTEALSRSSSKANQDSKPTTSAPSSSKPVRTSSLLKAENKHKAITKSLFSELHAKHGDNGTSTGGPTTPDKKSEVSSQVIHNSSEEGQKFRAPFPLPEDAKTRPISSFSNTSSTVESRSTQAGYDFNKNRQKRASSLIDSKRDSKESQESHNFSETGKRASSLIDSKRDSKESQESRNFSEKDKRTSGLSEKRDSRQSQENYNLSEKDKRTSGLIEEEDSRQSQENYNLSDKGKRTSGLIEKRDSEQSQENYNSSEKGKRTSSLIEKRRGSKERLSLDLSRAESLNTTGVEVRGGGESPEQSELVTTAPLSPLEEAQQTINQGTVGRLVKGKFKGLNLTARLLDAKSPIEKKKEPNSDEKPKYKFLVEGIDVPKSEENNESIVGVSEALNIGASGESSGAYNEEENATNFSTLSSTTSGGDGSYTLNRTTDQEDSAPSEGNSLERTHRPKRGFTYIKDEKLAEEVTKRATSVTARKPHELAEKVHEYKVSTLEREREEKALTDARAKLHKATPVEKSHTLVSDQDVAYSSVLHGIKERAAGNLTEVKKVDSETLVSERGEASSGVKEERGELNRSTRAGSSTRSTTGGTRSDNISRKNTTETQRTSTTRQMESSGGDLLNEQNMIYSNRGKVGGGAIEMTRERMGREGRMATIISSGNMGQLSPDSAYQSDSHTLDGSESLSYSARGGSTGAGYNTKGGELARGGGGASEPQELTVQRILQDETVAQGAHSRYESKQTLLTENKVSNQSYSEPGTSGLKEYNISSERSSYSKTYSSTNANDGGGQVQESNGAGLPGDNYVVTTSRNESITRVGGGGGEGEEREGVESLRAGGSTYVDRHTNFSELFKPADVELQPKRGSTKHSLSQNVIKTTTTTTTTHKVGAEAATGAAAAGAGDRERIGRQDGTSSSSVSTSLLTEYPLQESRERGGGRGRRIGHTDVTSKQVREEEEVGGIEKAGSETQVKRHYLPVGEDGAVRMTVGGSGGGETSFKSNTVEESYYHPFPTTTATDTTPPQPLPPLIDSSSSDHMRVENKENHVSSQHILREAQYSSSSSANLPPGGSERHPLGNQSSFSSADYSTANNHLLRGQQPANNRVIPLAPLTVDINTSNNDSFEMATHPASVTSPTVKHTMTMFEMSEMTDGASGNFGRAPYDGYYDGPYGGSLQQNSGYSGSRYMPPARPHFEDGLDFQNLHNLRNTYQEQTLSSQQSSYKSSQYNEYTDGASGGGFDTVSRSFRHIPGSPSQPKYLKVDESRSGSMPMYRDHNITVREGGGGTSYRQGIQGYAGRNRHEGYVSTAYVEEHGGLHSDPYDGDSVKSEPAYKGTRRSEKILSNRRPLRRHASSVSGNPTYHTLPSRRVQLDSGLMQDGGYSSSGGPQGYSTLRSTGAHRSQGSLYSPDGGPPIVSPELKGARKKQDLYGDEYHITLKLNQLNKDIGASRASLHNNHNEMREDRYASAYRRQDNMHTSAMSLPDMHNTYNSGAYDGHDDHYTSMREERYHYGDEGYGGSPTRTVTHVELDSPQVREQFEDRLSWYRARRAAQSNPPQMSASHVDVSQTNGYHSFTSSAPPPQPEMPPPNEADYTMSIDQTMTMGYVPKHQQQQQVVEQVEEVHQSSPQKTNIYLKEERRQQEVNHQYEDEVDESGEPIPQVVRGSILIKNTIDTAGKPRVFDVVADDDEEEDFTVEDNSNMFHGKYFQARENPMYNSDEDLSRLHRKPAFTKIFNRSEREEFTEIPVNYGRANQSGGKSSTTTTTTTTKTSKSRANLMKGRKSEYHVSGRDETDLAFEDIHERTMRTRGPPPRRETKRSTEMEIARLIRNAPADSVKQRINVEREEEEIMGPLPVNHADGTDGDPSGMLNFDTISEKVDIGLQDGVAQLAVKVRCERIVPIRGIEDMFKKSSVIVTRLIEIDLGVTEERKRLYDNVMRGGMSHSMLEDGRGRRPAARGAERKLGTKETFKLYKMFMGIAEAEEGKTHEKLNIEQRIEDEKRLPDGADFEFDTEGIERDGFDFDENLGFNADELDNQLEHAIHSRTKASSSSENRVKLEAMPGGKGHLMRHPEPDTISYVSQASEQSDLLY